MVVTVADTSHNLGVGTHLGQCALQIVHRGSTTAAHHAGIVDLHRTAVLDENGHDVVVTGGPQPN